MSSSPLPSNRTHYDVDVLVVGGGTGGTAAAIQAARGGANTLLVSEFDWLGGMLTAAGVCAPDGNELLAFQTGMWGAFLRELRQRQPTGLDWGWVSFFTFDPRIGERIFSDWAGALPNLQRISGQTPQGVTVKGNRIARVEFEDCSASAQVVLDGTELGDLLALAEVPHRWSWEGRSHFDEPSAPENPEPLREQHPVQAMTWVALLQDFGEGRVAPEIPPTPTEDLAAFVGAWERHGVEKFLSYGRLPGNRFMLNWPHKGNDYGWGLNRLISSAGDRRDCLQEAKWHAQNFARFLQRQLGRRYGLAGGIFPQKSSGLALHPYFRESRRLVGLRTVCETDVLPMAGGQVAPLPMGAAGVEAIAVGNYANDHHYCNWEFPVRSKSLRWGGRWTGTPFALPYGCLVPAETDGLLACEKNISVSHVANGCTRLQPVVMNLGQAAGQAAALCVALGCQPRELPVRQLQAALLGDRQAPAAVIPLFDAVPDRPDWRHWQQYYLDRPQDYPLNGYSPGGAAVVSYPPDSQPFVGEFRCEGAQDYRLVTSEGTGEGTGNRTWRLVTLHPTVDRQLQTYPQNAILRGWGRENRAGNWLRVDGISS